MSSISTVSAAGTGVSQQRAQDREEEEEEEEWMELRKESAGVREVTSPAQRGASELPQ